MEATGAPLDESTVDPDPLVQFGQWYDDASAVMAMPEAMAVATVGPAGRPSVRMVLLKSFGPEGFAFYTNYESRKARELADNPHAALLFHWEPLGRQVRIEGPVGRTGDDESDAYFATRARGSQLGARASRQSRPINGRGPLEAEVASLDARFAGVEVPRPSWWGGLRVAPHSYEFWQHREDRLHDRLLYTFEEGAEEGAGEGAWRLTRLQP